MVRNGQDLALQKYGSRLVIRIHPIDKKKMLTGDIEDVKSLIESAFRELKTSGVIHPWNITISGYDFDPRHLAQIPEVVAWFRKVQEVHPYLAIFLSPFTLNPYLVSQLDTEAVETAKRADLTANQVKDIDAIATILNKTEQGLGDNYRKQVAFETQYKVSMQQVRELNSQISFAAGLYLSSHKVRKPILEKALRDAFERINSALDFG
jgi:hypothetical protein